MLTKVGAEQRVERVIEKDIAEGKSNQKELKEAIKEQIENLDELNVKIKSSLALRKADITSADYKNQ